MAVRTTLIKSISTVNTIRLFQLNPDICKRTPKLIRGTKKEKKRNHLANCHLMYNLHWHLISHYKINLLFQQLVPNNSPESVTEVFSKTQNHELQQLLSMVVYLDPALALQLKKILKLGPNNKIKYHQKVPHPCHHKDGLRNLRSTRIWIQLRSRIGIRTSKNSLIS